MTSKDSGKPSATDSIKLISEDDVIRVLTWDALLKEIRASLIAVSRGPDHPEGAVQPLRITINIGEDGILLVMPGLMKAEKALAIKVLTNFPSNSSKNIATHHATILLMNDETGAPAAVLDGEVITQMRTAAASAVATMELVAKKDDLTIAVLGAGVQGRSHARVMAHVFKNCKIRIWNRNPEAAQTLVTLLVSENIKAEVSKSVQEAVRDADIINTCTATKSPILKAEWVKPGTHINSVGAPAPDKQEMEEDLVRQAIIYTDSREAAENESGDVIKAGASVFAEIGEVLLGSKSAYTNSITIYKSLGLAVQDAVSAKLVYNILHGENPL